MLTIAREGNLMLEFNSCSTVLTSPFLDFVVPLAILLLNCYVAALSQLLTFELLDTAQHIPLIPWPARSIVRLCLRRRRLMLAWRAQG